MPAWDRRPLRQQRAARERAVQAQLVQAVAPFSPFWRQRLAELGRSAASTGSLAGLAGLPPVGERDVCPDGDPIGAAALVLQIGERGYALHAEGPRLRRALLRRLTARGAYAEVVETDSRPTTYVWAGLGLRFPIASTRGDLDVVARAGARLWQVLGLDRADVLVAALPPDRAEHQALSLAALGAGAPALAVDPAVDELAEALRLLPATVLALPSEAAAGLLDRLEALPAELRTLLLVGAPDEREREDAGEALRRLGADRTVVLAVHVPDGHRLPWGQCRPSAGDPRVGLHALPDLEVLHVVDPETGAATDRAGELVLTQLGLRGSALVRWRTGDLVDGIAESPCPACGRTVPRVLGVRRGALVRRPALRGGRRPVDLRSVTGALARAGNLADWRVEVSRSARDGADQLLLHVVPRPSADVADLVVAVTQDVRAASGVLPTQVVLTAARALPDGRGPSPRVLLGR